MGPSWPLVSGTKRPLEAAQGTNGACPRLTNGPASLVAFGRTGPVAGQVKQTEHAHDPVPTPHRNRGAEGERSTAQACAWSACWRFLPPLVVTNQRRGNFQGLRRRPGPQQKGHSQGQAPDRRYSSPREKVGVCAHPCPGNTFPGRRLLSRVAWMAGKQTKQKNNIYIYIYTRR